jgi:short-subunit dehydrogenase
VHIQELCPGFTITDFHEKIGLDPATFYKSHGFMRSWSSEFVVKKSLEDLKKGKVVSVPGWNYKLMVMALRRLPISWVLWIASEREKGERYSN